MRCPVGSWSAWRTPSKGPAGPGERVLEGEDQLPAN
jgi:hypothetical protein